MPTLSVKQEVEAFKRRLLTERLLQCTREQQDFFWTKVWNVPVLAGQLLDSEQLAKLNIVPADRLSSSIELCNRTIYKNKNGGASSATLDTPPPPKELDDDEGGGYYGDTGFREGGY